MAAHSNIDVWEFITAKHAKNIAVTLLYVLQSEGSSPGRQGFKMAVAADGEINGTIGGGIMEHKFVEMAGSFLQRGNEEQGIYRQIHDKSAAQHQSGMICSGEQTIFLYRIQDADILQIDQMIKSVKANEHGTFILSNSGISFSNDIPASDFFFTQESETFTLKEKTGFKNTIHIIGGGHCALALSKLMSDMDFYIVVYDERDTLNTMRQNIYANTQIIVNSYTDLKTIIKSDPSAYVVIMTFGYRTDDIALRSLKENIFRYIGVLGSGKKMEKLFGAYRAENISESFLNKIHSPIGIQIKSRTTAEIAVSIAAEIISVKNS